MVKSLREQVSIRSLICTNIINRSSPLYVLQNIYIYIFVYFKELSAFSPVSGSSPRSTA